MTERVFERFALTDALERLGYPPEAIRQDYPARGSLPGPCLALALGGNPTVSLALVTVAVLRYLHDRMNDELFDAWAGRFALLVANARVDEAGVLFFPGWALGV